MRIYEILYADDIVLMAHTEAAIVAMVGIFEEVSTSFGQRINAGKTKVMVVQNGPNGVPDPVIEIRQEARRAAERTRQQQQGNGSEEVQEEIPKEIIEVVTQFKYLGSMENSQGTMEQELEKRLCAMAYSFSRLRSIVFQNKNLTVRTRLSVYNATILGAGLYGSASWNLSVADMDRLEHANFKYLRRIIPGVTWDTSYEKTLKIAGEEHGVVLEPIEMRIHQRALSMLSKTETKPGKCLVKQMIYGRVTTGEGDGRGHGRLQYHHMVKRALESYGESGSAVPEACSTNHTEWDNFLCEEGKIKFMDIWLHKHEQERLLRHAYDERVAEETAVEIARWRRVIEEEEAVAARGGLGPG